MRLVMLSDQESKGGAAIAASRLANAFVKIGLNVVRIVDQGDGGNHPWSTRVFQLSFREKVLIGTLRKLSLPLASSLRSRLLRGKLRAILREHAPDIINIHNLHDTVWGPDLVSVCTQYAPTVWTLHDMWSFTGRCIYSYDCRKFINGCDSSCPTPMEYPAVVPKLIAGEWEMRRRILAENKILTAVCPSRWLAREALAGLWKANGIEVIPYGLPLDVYVPLDRALARAALGIEVKGLVLLVAAHYLAERRKGGSILAEALRNIRIRPLTLITLGHEGLPILSEDIKIHSLGYVDHDRLKVLAYNAADILVHPALVDNLPNVIMEAMACGTPCIAFSIGGIPDMIRPGFTGWLAKDVTVSGLARALEEALTEIKRGVDLRSTCRGIAETKYDDRIQAQRYLELFAKLQRTAATQSGC